jgi:uncharacterized protein YdhG (YjbR/CyaY superfamily)
MKKQPVTIDDYIASCPKQAREKLEALRRLVHESVPGAEERIHYGMAAFFSGSGYVVWLAGYARHVGFYPGEQAITGFKRELSGYKSAVGSVRFPLDEELPVDLIRRMLEYRVDEVKRKG